MPPQSSLLDVLINYMIFFVFILTICLKANTATLSIQINIVEKDWVYFILGKDFCIPLMPLPFMNSLLYK